MRYTYKVFFCCALLAAVQEVALEDKEDKSDETTDLQDNPEMAEGPPDSHEAMNNREINPITKARQKRSYEFLMGLINNNSRYQVTRDEPAINLPSKQASSNDGNIGASELLLELLVKITANPDQWSRVHNLLRQIDQDIITSKQLIEDYQNNTKKLQAVLKEVDATSPSSEETTVEPMEERSKKKYKQEEINKEVAMTSDNGQPDINTSLFINPVMSTMSTKEWPTFDDQESKVNFVNKELSSNDLVDRIKPTNVDSSTTKAYPKYFSYHRVTGKPIFINRNPKAYVAVSVVAPKSPEVRTDEDLELEHELRQLKPWTHSQNLRNMESIRSRWVIDTSKESKKPEV